MKAYPFERATHENATFPWYGWFGLLLVSVFWALNWELDGLRTHWGFFPLWLGYILLMEAVLSRNSGYDLVANDFKSWLFLFLVSSPVWWVFEWINERTGYWEYLPVDSFSTFAYAAWCSLNFAIVIPAVFATSALFRNLDLIVGIGQRVVLKWNNPSLFILHVLGWVMLAVTWWRPEVGAPLVWMSLFFIFDPINYWRGKPSLLRQTGQGDWRMIFSLAAGTLVCGFFWEMWNFYSSPKWVYHIPFVDFWYVFEMPLPGYLGYIPFGWELYAMYQLLFSFLSKADSY